MKYLFYIYIQYLVAHFLCKLHIIIKVDRPDLTYYQSTYKDNFYAYLEVED